METEDIPHPSEAKKPFGVLFTTDQIRILGKKAKDAGFQHKSEYIRYVLFLESDISEKIDKIYKKLFQND